MDGVLTMCRTTPECARMDGHEGACNIPVRIMRRTPSSRLRYLAGEVGKEWDPVRQLAIASELENLARELE